MTLITVNGEAYEVPGGWRIADLLLDLGVGYTPVSVERNGKFVPRCSCEDIALQTNDRIEFRVASP
ncbi:MAG: sulfur carrier protein ThiS [Gammaproteobacteria bacterium]|nr:sulfur carrier protein ThiS [Gammaproteobacteria bacterium]